jgi:hypothetical protein
MNYFGGSIDRLLLVDNLPLYKTVRGDLAQLVASRSTRCTDFLLHVSLMQLNVVKRKHLFVPGRWVSTSAGYTRLGLRMTTSAVSSLDSRQFFLSSNAVSHVRESCDSLHAYRGRLRILGIEVI